MFQAPIARAIPVLALAALALACRPTYKAQVPPEGDVLAPPPAASAAPAPAPLRTPSPPRVRVVPGSTPEPAPPGMVVEPPEADPEEMPPGEGLVTLEAPAEWRGENDVHLQVLMPNADDPDASGASEAVAVEVELRKDGVFRDPVVVRGEVTGERLAAGQVGVLLAGLKDEDYELVVRALDGAGGVLDEAERDFALSSATAAPYLVRFPASGKGFAIDEASRPYVQQPAPGAMAVMWTSGKAAKGGLVVTDADGAPVAEREGPAGLRHAFTLSDLVPGRRYRWTAREDGGAVGSGTFQANPGPDMKKIRFAAYGDCGRGTRAQFEVARRMAAWKPAFAIVAGDVVYPNGEARHYGPRFLAPYHQMMREAVIYPALGNHDYRSGDGQPLLDFFEVPRAKPADTERYYAFTWGHLQVFALDTNQDLEPGSPQTTWLAKALAASQATWKVAFFHHPPYSSGEHGSSMHVREAWEPLFERHDVQLVVSGHDHHYERMVPQEAFVKDGVPTQHVLTGGGGAGLRSVERADFTAFATARHHFVGVTIDDRTLSLEAIDNRGAVFDRWRYELPE